MAHDYYVVLGIRRDADPGQIRRAYRKLVRLYHPDTGGRDEEKFLEVQRAFETLADQESRRLYDRQLRSPGEQPAPRVQVRRPRTAEPRPSVQPRGPLEEFLSGQVPGVHSRGFTGRRDLYAELILDPSEAATGGLFPLSLPVRRICPTCNGSGHQGSFVCRPCRGTGVRVEYDTIEISVPPRVDPDTTVRISLADIGLPHVDLVILVTVRS